MRIPAQAQLRALVVEQRSMLLSSFGSLILRIGGLASTFLLGVLLARVLGPAEYGIYGLVSSIVALAMNFALLGTPQLAVREMAVRSARSDWSGVHSLARSLLATTSLASIALGVIAVALAAVFGADSRTAGLALIGALLAAGMGMTSLVAAELRGLGLLLKGQFMDIVGRPAAAMILTAAAWIVGVKLTAARALWVQVFVAAMAAVVSLVWLSRAAGKNERRKTQAEGYAWLRAALPLGIVDVLRTFDGAYGIILVGILGSAVDLGIYRVAIASAVLATMPVTILHVVLAPTVSRLYRFGEHAELQRLLRFASASMCLALIPMFLVLLAFGRPLVELVFGHAYAGAWLPLTLLCAAQVIFGFFGMGPILLAMADSERHLTRIYVIAVTVGIIAALFLIRRFGASGAASAQILSMSMVAALSNRFARRQLGLGTTFVSRVTPATEQPNGSVR